MKIITLTLSPAVDVEFHLKGEINAGGLNRAADQVISAGGKGINVSRSIVHEAKKDGIKADFLHTVAPVGGVCGKMIENILADEGISLTAIGIDGNTRLNASVIPQSGKAEEINAPGTPIGDARSELEKTLFSMIGDGDAVVIAGSTPKDIEKSYPAYLIGEIHKRGGYAVLDCDGEALKIAVTGEKNSRPDLIKPNTDELCELTGMPTDTKEEAMSAAESMTGITVITTMAGDGSVLTKDGESKFFPTKKREVVRQKGAGDTFLGAFVYAYRYKEMTVSEAMIHATDAAGRYVAGE